MDRRQVVLEFFLVGALILAAYWFTTQALDIYQNSGLTDFDILFHSAQKLEQGGDPYNVRELRDAPFGGYYKFPPLVDLLLAPFTAIEWHTVARVYILFSLCLYLATFALLVISQGLTLRSPPFYLLGIVFFLWQPSLDTLNGAQHEFVILFLFTVSAVALASGPPRQGLAGLALSIPIIIKLYPLLLVLYLALRRFWRALIVLGVVLAALTGISVLLGGWGLQRQFWFQILPSLSGGTAMLENQSFFAFFARLWVNGATVDPARVTVLPIATYLSYAAIAASVLFSLFILWRSPGQKYAFAILVPLMLLVGPNSWIHYETLLLLPLGILFGAFSKNASPWTWLVLALAVGLVAFGNEDNVQNTTLGLIQSYKFYGVLLFWLLGIYAVWKPALRPHVQPKVALMAQTAGLAAKE